MGVIVTAADATAPVAQTTAAAMTGADDRRTARMSLSLVK
jgi:hypothetical protein